MRPTRATAPQPSFAAGLRRGVTLPVLIDPAPPERVLVDWESKPGGAPDLATRLAVIGPSWPRLERRSSNWGWLLLVLGLALTAVKVFAVVWSIVATPVPPPLLLAGAMTAWFGPIIALIGLLLLVTRRRTDLRRRRADRRLRYGQPAVRQLDREPDSTTEADILEAPPYHLENLLIEGADVPVRLANPAEPLIDWPALEAETAPSTTR